VHQHFGFETFVDFAAAPIDFAAAGELEMMLVFSAAVAGDSDAAAGEFESTLEDLFCVALLDPLGAATSTFLTSSVIFSASINFDSAACAASNKLGSIEPRFIIIMRNYFLPSKHIPSELKQDGAFVEPLHVLLH
jgi:hypothetical protein